MNRLANKIRKYEPGDIILIDKTTLTESDKDVIYFLNLSNVISIISFDNTSLTVFREGKDVDKRGISVPAKPNKFLKL